MARMSRERDRAARVRRALKACPDLDATRIRVVIEDNVVHLRGAVRAHSARVLARALACDVDGVSRVVDELVVAPVASVRAERERHTASSSPKRDTTRGWSWLSQ